MPKEEIISLKPEETLEKSPEDFNGFDRKDEDILNLIESEQNVLKRKMFPIDTPLKLRSVKSGSNFVLSGLVRASATVATVDADGGAQGTTETNLNTFDFNPNELHSGVVIRLTARGAYTATAAGPTVTLRMKFGATTHNSVASTSGAASNVPWNISWIGIVSATGTSGAVEGQPMGYVSQLLFGGASTATTALNTTIAQTFALTAQWSAATAGNVISIRQFLLEVLN